MGTGRCGGWRIRDGDKAGAVLAQRGNEAVPGQAPAETSRLLNRKTNWLSSMTLILPVIPMELISYGNRLLRTLVVKATVRSFTVSTLAKLGR